MRSKQIKSVHKNKAQKQLPIPRFRSVLFIPLNNHSKKEKNLSRSCEKKKATML